MGKNISKIQYLSIADSKIYKVTDIDFRNMTIEANETDLCIADVPESEVFPVEEFAEFRVRLINHKNKAKIIDMEKWIREHGL